VKNNDKSKKKILVLCPHPENVAPGQRLKYEQYFEYLRDNGFDITVSPFQTKALWKVLYKQGHVPEKVAWVLFGYARRAFDLARLPFYDGAFVFLLVTPLGPALFERACRKLARRVVYDIDDLVILNRTSAANRIVASLRGTSKYFYMMKAADHVITCTPYLDEVVRKHNAKTTDISSTINTDTYVPKASYENDHRLVIGWSGSFSTSPYLKLLAEPLRRLRKKLDFKLLVIGDASFQMDGVDVEALPWVESTEVRDLSRIDIGLYPLPDEQWVYGKSGLKALQYMALGIPTIATAIGANFRVIEDGVSGHLVKTEDEWVDRLERLASDAALRKQIGQAARKRVEDRFSIKANRDTYLGIFREVYGT
jgi:glycosyltransferase involved in cell wall biosynthesis